MNDEFVGYYFNGCIRDFFILPADRPFVVKTGNVFWGYNSLMEAESAKKTNDDIFQFIKGQWHKFISPASTTELVPAR